MVYNKVQSSMFKDIINFFDRLEDKIRGFLSTRPIVYAAIVSVGTVFLWRGIWLVADAAHVSGPVSILIGSIILLLTGIFVSSFIGNRILISGIKNEKKLADKTQKEIEADIQSETKVLHKIQDSLTKIERKIGR